MFTKMRCLPFMSGRKIYIREKQHRKVVVGGCVDQGCYVGRMKARSGIEAWERKMETETLLMVISQSRAVTSSPENKRKEKMGMFLEPLPSPLFSVRGCCLAFLDLNERKIPTC